MMKLAHRSLLVGLLLTIFVIILIGKLDGKSSWNWVVVLTPIWIMDVLTLLLVHTKRQSDIYFNTTFNQIVYYCLAAKVIFQVLLCIRLEVYPSMPIYVIMSPLWCLLFMLSCNLFQKIISSSE